MYVLVVAKARRCSVRRIFYRRHCALNTLDESSLLHSISRKLGLEMIVTEYGSTI